jgi:hypothetical protein
MVITIAHAAIAAWGPYCPVGQIGYFLVGAFRTFSDARESALADGNLQDRYCIQHPQSSLRRTGPPQLCKPPTDGLKPRREPVRTEPPVPTSSAVRSLGVALVLLGISLVMWGLLVVLGHFRNVAGG